MKSTVTLKCDGFVCSGTATMRMWGGGEGAIEMNKWRVIGYPMRNLRQAVMKGVNDGGFGCEAIIEADVDVYQHYKDSCHVEFIKTFYFKEKELKKAKRGI